MNANRRLQERKHLEQKVLCKLGGEESSLVLNLSEDGLCFESLKPIEETGLLQLRLSVDLNSVVEATGQLAWIDSAKRTGGLRFLELSAPAREQIRAWMSETSAAFTGKNRGALWQKRDKQADDRAVPDKPAPYKPAIDTQLIWQETRAPSTQLVPIERHRAQKRRQFLGGLLLGFGICAGMMIAFFRYAGGTMLGSLAWTTASADRAAQPRGEQTQTSAVPAASPGASAVLTRSPQSQKQSPPSAAASSTDRMTRTSSPSATLHTSKLGERVASSQPSTKPEPLEASQSAAAPAPVASKPHSSSGSMERPVERQALRPKKAPPTPQQLWSALQAGNVKAAIALADLYARGEGVPVNCQQARVLLLAASAKKNAEASKKLQELDNGGCPANSNN